MKTKRKNRGFTLVELIVTLTVLATLTGMLVPSLTGYIDNARERVIISEARDIYVAASAALAETYGLRYKQLNKSDLYYYNTKPCYRISNSSLGSAQKKDEQRDTGTKLLAYTILEYLSSTDKNHAEYNFINNETGNGYLNPSAGTEYDQIYLKSKNADACTVVLCVSLDWKINYLEYARGIFLIRIDRNTDKITVTKRGKFTQMNSRAN